jgi:hypothetical protein
MAAINASGIFTGTGGANIFTSSNSGAANSLTIKNTSNTSGADAVLKASVNSSAGGDPYLLIDTPAIVGWYVGSDTSNSSRFVIGTDIPGNADKLLITTAGAVTIPGTLGVSTGAAVGGATPGAGGLAFPATAVAVADANTLDDYEEGTWTPTFSGSVNVTGTPTFSYGRYTKVGRLVTISCQVNATITTANLLTYPAFSLPITAIANPAVAGSAGCGSSLNSVGYCEVTTSLAYMFFPAASLIPSGAQTFLMSITYVAA